MKIFHDYPALRNPLMRTLERLGLSDCTDQHLADPRFLDHLLREIHAEAWLPEPVRAEAYTAFLGSGPGGLQAFAWLVEHGHASLQLARDYVSCLPLGRPLNDALQEAAALEVAEGLLGLGSDTSPEQHAGLAACLLCARALGAAARKAVFRRLFSAPWFGTAQRRLVAGWAVGEDLPQEVYSQIGLILPDSPAELHGAGLLALVQLGEPPDEVAALGLARPDPDGLRGLLDLVDLFADRLSADLRHTILERARRQSSSSLRRRAYSLGGRLEGEGFLRLGLRDRDSAVRSWVLARFPEAQQA